MYGESIKKLPPSVGKSVAIRFLTTTEYTDEDLETLVKVINEEIEKSNEIQSCVNCGAKPIWKSSDDARQPYLLVHGWYDDKWCPERFGGHFYGRIEAEAIQRWNTHVFSVKSSLMK